MWMLPFAYGGPSCSTNFGAPARPHESCRRGPWPPSGRASRGSLVGRFAFIGKSVRGRLTVSFHSGMGIQRFYNEVMRSTTLDNGLKVLIQEEHTAPLASVWCWYKVGSKDERPGLTGVSHWVEHMNFKGTTNIPRDQVKGIIEQFGGSWNGYTWIDQTTYLETATRDALDRMLFIESERMASCLYHPDDCESERTVIISELQGGENDPDQLLDQEVTATAFKAHTYRHPTIGWLPDLQTMTRDDLYGYYRRYYVPEQRHARHRRRRRHGRGASPVEHHFGAIQPGPAPFRGCRRSNPSRPASGGVTIRKGGNDRVPESVVSRAGRDRHRFRSARDSRRRADRRQRTEPLVELSCGAAAAERALVSSARRPRPRVERLGIDRADRAAVSVHRVGDGDRAARRSRATEAVLLEELDRVQREGITAAELAKAKAQLKARLVFENDSVTNIAHQLGYFETIASVDLFTTLPPAIASATIEDVAAAARRVLPAANRTIGWFDPLPILKSSSRGGCASRP